MRRNLGRSQRVADYVVGLLGLLAIGLIGAVCDGLARIRAGNVDEIR